MNLMLALRWSDALIFVMAVCLALVFTSYVAANFRFWRTPWVSAAIGLATYFTGHAIIRGVAWIMYLSHYDMGAPDRADYAAVLLLGSTIMTMGALCVAKVFLTASWRPWVWKAAGVTVAFLFFIMMLV